MAYDKNNNDNKNINACKDKVKKLFLAHKYEDVYDCIKEFKKIADSNKTWADQNLWEYLGRLPEVYIVPRLLTEKQNIMGKQLRIDDWEKAFVKHVSKSFESFKDVEDFDVRDFISKTASSERFGLRNAIDEIEKTFDKLMDSEGKEE